MERRLSRLQDTVLASSVTTTTATPQDVVPAMVNFVDDSDFIFSDSAYNTFAYANSGDVLAQWYARTQATASSYTESTNAAESGESIRRAAHAGGRRTGSLWKDSEGSLLLTGGYRASTRLAAKYVAAGNYLASRLQISFHDVSFTATSDFTTDKLAHTAHGLANGTRVQLTTTGTLPAPLAIGTDYYVVSTAANDFQLSLTIGGSAINLTDNGSGTHTVVPMIYTNIKLKISLWDNTANEILKGSPPAITLSKAGAHAGGTVKREFILEVVMPDGKTFYSDTATPANVTNTVATTTVDSNNYVNISWPSITGASRYRLYRRTPLEADTHWYLIQTVTNGSSSAKDFGGVGGGIWTVPSFDNEHKQYQRAEAFFDDIGTMIQTADSIQELSVGIQAPYNFTPNGNQFLQIEFLKSDYSATTNAEVPTDSIRVDHVGLSYTNGRWVYSARDMTKIPAPTGTPTPPASGGGTGDNPPAGGGRDTCVREDVPILMWSDDGNHYWMPANEIVIGDRLVCWDVAEGKLAPTKVYRVVTGASRANHLVYAGGKELPCSFSHRVIEDFNDFATGTRVTMLLDRTLMYEDGNVVVNRVESVETIEDIWIVKTFHLQKGKRNYIANGFFSHNVKNEFNLS